MKVFDKIVKSFWRIVLRQASRKCERVIVFEFIGIVVVGWFAFKIILAIVRSSKGSTNEQYGLEARRIATQDLFVPTPYYNYVVNTRMDILRKFAVTMKERSSDFEQTSWPRLLALSIYTSFHFDCNSVRSGDAQTKKLFDQLEITKWDIDNALNYDIEDILKQYA